MNKVASRTKGYTVVETMIFLAVSGLLLLSAMLLIGGQQRKTQFAITVREFDSKIQSVVSNVANGYYNNTGSTNCIVTGGVITTLSDTGGTSGQNAGCTFIGQVIVPTPLGVTPSGVTIYSTAGLRQVIATSKEVQSIAEAQPKLITATQEFYTLNAGVTATIKIVGGVSVNSLGIFTTFNGYSNNLLKSGSTQSDLYAIGPSAVGVIESALAVPVPPPPPAPTALGGYQVNPSNGIQICLSETGGSQVGVIVLNNGSTRTSIESSCP